MDNETVAYTITQEQLNEVAAIAGQKGAEHAIKVYTEKEEKERKRREKESDKVELTKRMLRDYRAVKEKVAKNPFSDQDLPELRFKALEDLMGVIRQSDDRTEKKIQAKLHKHIADLEDLKRIDDAYTQYKEGCEQWGTEEDLRRCREVYMLYMDDTVYTVEEIAETENIAERSVYRDVGIACKKLAAYLFGF